MGVEVGMNTRYSAIAALLFAASGCAQSASKASSAGESRTHDSERCDSCNVPVAPGVTLSPAEQCVLDAYRRRCAKHDACIVDCLANRRDEVTLPDGRGGRVGGGCWHVCFAYTGIKWSLPTGVSACDSPGGSRAIGSLLPNPRMQPTGRGGAALRSGGTSMSAAEEA